VLRSLSLCVLACMLGTAARADEWIPLFNGKDLEGWTPKIKGYDLGDNHNDTFRVKDGCICVVYDKYTSFDGKFGHLFYKTPYSHYRLRLEYRFVGEQCKGGPGWATRNSGIMIHGQDPKTMRKDQDFPVSVEVQLLGGNGKTDRTTGNVCSPGTHITLDGKLNTTHCNNSKSKTYHGDGWVKAEVEVLGHGTVKHFIEGQLVLQYEKVILDEKDKDGKLLIKDGKTALEGGTLSLQAESHPCEFRNIEILPLKK
jgi:hypothetical protein